MVGFQLIQEHVLDERWLQDGFGAKGESRNGREMLKQEAGNSGQWAVPRHRSVLSIYTFNYSFGFQLFWLLEHSASWFTLKIPPARLLLYPRLRLWAAEVQRVHERGHVTAGPRRGPEDTSEQERSFLPCLATHQRQRGRAPGARLEPNH